MESSLGQIAVRLAVESDLGGVRDVVHACYGDGFFPEFYDEGRLKKMVYGDGTLMVVAEDQTTGAICGLAAVLLEIGASFDLVGEFGRLIVHPSVRNRGIGARLLEKRVRLVRDRLHVGLMETRVSHPYSLMNGLTHGFAPVGFLPAKLFIQGSREHLSLQIRYFGDALDLRRNHPRLIPEAHGIASLAMENVGVKPDFIVDETAPSYPSDSGYDIQELSADAYTNLLRIERGRVDRREVFGPLRLHYGFFKIASKESTYLIARENGRVVAALGFAWNEFERNVRVFEVIQLGDRAVRALFESLARRCAEELNAATIEVDVSAHAPRMQRTLIELGYVPSAYVPALAFHRVERLDVIKMVRVFTPTDLPMAAIPSPAAEVADLVLNSFAERALRGRVGEAVDGVEIFAGLTLEQQTRLAACLEYRRHEVGDHVFSEGTPGEEMYVVLDGRIAVRLQSSLVGYVERGECLGEVALLTEREHSASAVVVEPLYTAVLTRGRLGRLVRLNPDIGVVLYRNLARGLGKKLRRTDLSVTSESGLR